MMLGINFAEHPSRHNIYVFEFTEEERTLYFEQLLQESKIEFEKEIHEKNGIDTTFYGINKRDLKAAKHINYLVSAKYRKPFIADPVLRYFTLTFAIAVLLLAFLGAIFGSTS